jgi:hypothetical protein
MTATTFLSRSAPSWEVTCYGLLTDGQGFLYQMYQINEYKK